MSVDATDSRVSEHSESLKDCLFCPVLINLLQPPEEDDMKRMSVVMQTCLSPLRHFSSFRRQVRVGTFRWTS